MHTEPVFESSEFGHVSTGSLPTAERVESALRAAYGRYRLDTDGALSQVYPALARVPADLFGICLAGVGGALFAAGDTDIEFTIMSISKPFVFALVCDQIGPRAAQRLLGANATGLPFNSIHAVENSADGRTNPMVNSGAIMTTSLTPGATAEERWAFIHDGLSKFAGRTLPLNDEIYQSATETNFRNRSIAHLLHSRSALYSDPAEATDLYTRQCSLNVTAKDLAVMGATLAHGGINPVTGERIIGREVCHYTLATMATAGMYETSGDWLYEVGLPGKSGIGGGLITVAPGKGGLATFAPLLDSAGHSVKGQHVARYLSQQLGMDLFISGD
jgi:glutaminase